MTPSDSLASMCAAAGALEARTAEMYFKPECVIAGGIATMRLVRRKASRPD
jgi:hypothetical protein